MSEGRLCPSAPASDGASLLGLVKGDQTIAMLPSPIPVDQAFIEAAREHGALEKRFRFTKKCVKSGCRQWTDGKCGVIDLLTKVNKHIEASENLRPCAIRDRCRWFSQEGAHACEICTFVVTDNDED